MKFYKWAGMVGMVLLSQLILCGMSTGDIPPISVQNGHTTISADFFADAQQGSVPFMVTFTDASTGVIDHREWFFGDEEISGEINPVHIYYEPGVYTVSLQISGSGGTDKKIRIGYITVSESISEESIPVERFSTDIPSPDMPPGVVQNGELSLNETPAVPEEEVTLVPEPSSPATLAFGDIDGSSVEPGLAASNVHAEFAAGDPVGLAPLKVSFSDLSSGLIHSWNWNFGDGTSSAATAPIHIYQNPGVYDVSLTIEGDGNTDSMIKQGLVSVVEPASAAFTARPVEGVAPLTVAFSEQSTGTLIKREWTFGDDSESDVENPVHIYEKPGIYEVTLKVSGAHNEDVLTRPSYIVVHPDLPPPTPVETPLPIPTFIPVPEPFLPDIPPYNIPQSSEPDLTPQLVESGSESTEIADVPEDILISEESEELALNPPAVDFSITPESGTQPLLIHCSDTSTGDIISWLWQFGDGNISTEQNPSHLYESAGEFTINLTIYGPGAEGGVSKEKTLQVTSPPDAPKADFSMSSTEGTAPLPIVCTDQSTGEITDWIWDFGDGKLLRGKNPTHTYSQPGQYSITLRVKGPGGTDQMQKNGVINVLSPPLTLEAAFSAVHTNGNVPLEVAFTDQSTGIATGWTWQFGDGEGSAEQHPVHMYQKAGTYNVSLIVSGPDGTSETTSDGYIIAKDEPLPVRASFSALPISGEAPLAVTFSDKTVGDASSWTWQFGDGETSDQKDPIHTYSKPGIYTVTLQTRGPGGEDEAIKTDLISVLGSDVSPELVISAEPVQGTAPLSVAFTKSVIGNEMGYLWDFGDGNISREEEPIHLFSNPGLYNISLTIHDVSGNNRTIMKNQFINATRPIPPPIAGFTSNVTEGIVPCQVRFTDASQGDISDWKWDFGDGSYAITRDPTHIYVKPGLYSVQLTVQGPGGLDRYSGDQIITVLKPVQNVTPVAETVLSPEKTNKSQISLISEDIPSEVPDNTQKPGNETQFLMPEEKSNLTLLNTVIVEDIVQQNQTISFIPDSIEPAIDESENNGNVSQIQRDSDNRYENVSELSEIPSISASVTSGPSPLRVNFTSTWAGESGSFHWDFGDGLSSNQSEPVNVYLEPGTYSVHLTRSYDSGTQEIISNDLISVTKTVSIPVASFSTKPVSGPVPLNVTFMSDSSGDITSWLWDFGDSSDGSGETVSHMYNRAGTYSVGLLVSGSGGSSEEVRTDLITVGSPLTPPQAKFRTDKRTGFAPLTINFTDQSLGKVTEWTWDFGDDHLSKEKNPSHEFNKTGVFSVSLSVTGPTGTHSVSRSGYIVVSPKPQPLVAKFVLTPASGDAPLLIQCTDESSGLANRYLWEFGDGAVSESHNPSHRYTSPGSYSVKLTIYGTSGISSADQVVLVGPTLGRPSRLNGYANYPYLLSDTQNISEKERVVSSEQKTSKLVADFYLSRKSGRSPLKVQYYDQSSGTIETWKWNFGDGEISEEQNPVHVYSSAGTYTVSLTIKGTDEISTKKIHDAVTVF